MDQHTIRGLREEASQEGRSPKALVSLHPGDHLSTVLQKLFRNRCSMAPVLTGPARSVFQHTRTTCFIKMWLWQISTCRHAHWQAHALAI